MANRCSASAGRYNKRGFEGHYRYLGVLEMPSWETAACLEFDGCHNIQHTEQGKGKVPWRRTNPRLLDDWSVNPPTLIERLRLKLISHFQRSDLAASSEPRGGAQNSSCARNISLNSTCSTAFTTPDKGSIQVAKTEINPTKKAGHLPEKNQLKNAKSGGTNGGTEYFIKMITYWFSSTYINKKLTTSRLFNCPK